MNWQEKLGSYLTPSRQRLVLVSLLAIYTLLLTQQITSPFIGTSEAFNGMYGIAARNWVLRGPIELKFTQMTPYGAQAILPEITKDFYLNRPQFFIAPTALLYWLFGAGEWQTRASPIVFSLLSLLIFWVLIGRVFKTPWLTVTSSLFYIFFPIGIFYGRLLVHDSATMFFTLALFLSVILFEQKRQKRYLAAICTATFLGGLIDWPFFFAAAIAWLYVALKRDYPKRGAALSLIVLFSAVSLGITLLQIWSITGMNPISFLAAIFLDRSGGLHFSLVPFLLLMWTNFDLISFSEIGLLLATIGIISYLSTNLSTNKKEGKKILFAMLLFGPGLLVYLIFPGYAAVHQFISLHLVPPIALMAGWGAGRIRGLRRVIAVFAVFAISSMWYTGNLFAYKSFADGDFAMLKRANASVPASEPICMGENAVNTNIKFYLFPHQMDDSPCPPQDSYFVLRRPESYAAKNPSFSLLQTFFANNFWFNLKRVSVSAAAGMEVAKSVPFIRQKIEAVFSDHDPHKAYASLAERIQNFISEQKLQPIDCSINFCLYKKRG